MANKLIIFSWNLNSRPTIWRTWVEPWIQSLQFDVYESKLEHRDLQLHDQEMKLQSTSYNLTIMSWNLNLRPTIWRSSLETWIHSIEFENYEITVESTSVKVFKTKILYVCTVNKVIDFAELQSPKYAQ